MRQSFSKSEKRKIATVLAEQRDQFERTRGNLKFTNEHGGCPNCGDAGGFFTVMYELEKLFGLRDEGGNLRSIKPLRRAAR